MHGAPEASPRYACSVTRMRTFEEANEVILRVGRPSDHELLVLRDGRHLTTIDEIRAWLESIEDEPHDPSGCPS